MKFKTMTDKSPKVWVTVLKYAGQPVLAAQTADGTLLASNFATQRTQSSIISEWRRKYPQFAWQDGKPPKAANLKQFAPHGTEFQRAVWAKTAAIKSGAILTYGDIAKAVGKPKAARAVGTALGANPLVPFIPCHRVIGSNGLIGGYSGTGGLITKRALLKKENVILPD